MRIVINAVSGRTGGTFTYLTNLVPELLKATAEVSFVLVCGKDQERLMREVGEWQRLEFASVPVPSSSIGRAIWQQTHLPGVLRDIEHNLFYSPNNYTVFREEKSIPIVLAIRNPNPFFQSAVEYTATARLANLVIRELARFSARKANRVIFVSDCSRRLIAKRLNIPTEKTRVVYHGRSDSFSPRIPPTDEFPRPFILSVSNIYAHKNYPRLVESFALLKQKFEIPHHLVLIGRKSSETEIAKIHMLLEKFDLEDHVHMPGARPHQSLPEVYTAADLFILPSLLETFGHPLIEAMACGIPLAASNSASNPEICDGAAVLFDPLEPRAIADSLHQLIQDRALREKKVSRGLQRAQFFSWEKSARDLLQVFEEALNQ